MEQKRERPILFSTEMVKAILEGRKTQTRRIIKSRHESGLFMICRRMTDNQITSIESLDWDERNCEKDITCPYGKPGDVLWVKEGHYQFGKWIEKGKTKTGKQKWEFISTSERTLYFNNPPATNYSSRVAHNKKGNWEGMPTWYKRIARFMLKKDARIFLEITDIKVERVNEISEQDAIAEGIHKYECPVLGWRYKDYMKGASGYGHPDHDYPETGNAVDSFRTLWIKINGPESWNRGDWCWVIQFKILSPSCPIKRERE